MRSTSELLSGARTNIVAVRLEEKEDVVQEETLYMYKWGTFSRGSNRVGAIKNIHHHIIDNNNATSLSSVLPFLLLLLRPPPAALRGIRSFIRCCSCTELTDTGN